VHLLNYDTKKTFFFASLEINTLGYSADSKKLKIAINKAELTQLDMYPIPFYLFGIDENKVLDYFICANHLDATKNLNGILTRFPVNATNINLLWMEVAKYWKQNKEITKFVSHFN